MNENFCYIITTDYKGFSDKFLIKKCDVGLTVQLLKNAGYSLRRIGIATKRDHKAVDRWIDGRRPNPETIEALIKFARPRLSEEQQKLCGIY